MAISNNEVMRLFESGMTNQSIAIKFGVSRQAVNQRLKRLGLSRVDGGVSLIKIKNKESLNLKFISKYGCGHDTYHEVRNSFCFNGVTPQAAYFQFCRGKESPPIFYEWWRVWEESGVWHLRGRGKGFYCMARSKKDMPWAIENMMVVEFCKSKSAQ